MAVISMNTISDRPTKAFTLIELLVVVAIVAVLAVVVILTLNPAELLRQSRDTGRLSDMANLNRAISLFQTDNPSGSLGNTSTTYLSLVDPAATTTTGTDCASLNLPAAPASWAWHCAASSTLRLTNGQTGWLPVNLSSISSGSPLGTLPTDPVNTSSSGFYYTYTPSSTQWQQTAQLEAQKNAATEFQSSGNPTYATGSNPNLAPFAGGLVGWWKFDEGTGTVAYDYSGTNATGNWQGAQVGTSGYYSPGQVGSWAGAFDGTSTYANVVGTNLATVPSGNWTVSFWANIQLFYHDAGLVVFNGAGVVESASKIALLQGNNVVADSNTFPMLSTWTHIAVTRTGSYYLIYFQGQPNNGSLSSDNSWGLSAQYYIGRGYAGKKMTGLLDDIRVYNRALSAAEIQALYNAQK